MFCKNCGKELPDNAKFCNACGTPVAPPAPAAVPEEPVTVPETPEAAPETPAAADEIPPFQPAAPAAEEGAPAQSKKRRGASGIAVIAVGAVIAVVVLVLLFKLLSGALGGGGSKRTQAFAYLNDDYELMYLADLKEKTEAIEVTDDAGSNAQVQFTADGKTMYFLDSKDALYKIAVSELKKDGRPERISRDVIWFTVLKTGNVLYSKSGSKGTELNCYTGKDDFRIAKDYHGYDLSEDQKTIYYTELDEDDGTYTLYRMALKKDAQTEELLDGATDIYTDFDSSVLVYGEDELGRYPAADYSDDADRNTLTVYSCKPGDEPTELIDEVYGVTGVKVDGSKVSFYYYIEDLEKYSLYDLVSDSKQSADAAVTAEDLVRPNWYDEYYPDSFYADNGIVYYRDRQGNSFPIDTSALQASTGRPVEELYTWEVRPIAETAARELYDAAMEEYNGKYEEWNAANNRNRMRESLKNEEYTQRSHSIYQYNGAPSDTPIATGVGQNVSDDEAGIFLYKKAAGITGGKVCDLSELEYYSEIYNYLNAGSGDDDWYQNVGGTESVLELDEETYITGVYVLNGKEAVLALNEDGEPRLDAYSIEKTALTFANTVIDDTFAGLTLGTDTKGNDVLYFFTDTEDEDYSTLGDFNRYSGGGKPEVLAKEVYGVVILDDSGAMYAVTDMNSRDEGELSLLQGDKPTVISDEMDGNIIIFLDSKQVLYTADGDLYLWNGKENRRVAKDVEYVWANAEEDYSMYSPY